MFIQDADGFQLSGLGGDVHRGVSGVSAGVGVRPAFQQEAEDVRGGVDEPRPSGGEVDGGVLRGVVGGHVNVRAEVQHQFNPVQVVVVDGLVEVVVEDFAGDDVRAAVGEFVGVHGFGGEEGGDFFVSAVGGLGAGEGGVADGVGGEVGVCAALQEECDGGEVSGGDGVVERGLAVGVGGVDVGAGVQEGGDVVGSDGFVYSGGGDVEGAQGEGGLVGEFGVCAAAEEFVDGSGESVFGGAVDSGAAVRIHFVGVCDGFQKGGGGFVAVFAGEGGGGDSVRVGEVHVEVVFNHSGQHLDDSVDFRSVGGGGVVDGAASVGVVKPGVSAEGDDFLQGAGDSLVGDDVDGGSPVVVGVSGIGVGAELDQLLDFAGVSVGGPVEDGSGGSVGEGFFSLQQAAVDGEVLGDFVVHIVVVEVSAVVVGDVGVGAASEESEDEGVQSAEGGGVDEGCVSGVVF